MYLTHLTLIYTDVSPPLLNKESILYSIPKLEQDFDSLCYVYLSYTSSLISISWYINHTQYNHFAVICFLIIGRVGARPPSCTYGEIFAIYYIYVLASTVMFLTVSAYLDFTSVCSEILQ